MDLAKEKMKRFLQGWNSMAEGLVMPQARFDRELNAFVTWEQLFEKITPFEAFKLGQVEGARYRGNVDPEASAQ